VVAAALVVGVPAALVGVLPGPLGRVGPAAAAGAVELVDDVRVEVGELCLARLEVLLEAAAVRIAVLAGLGGGRVCAVELGLLLCDLLAGGGEVALELPAGLRDRLLAGVGALRCGGACALGVGERPLEVFDPCLGRERGNEGAAFGAVAGLGCVEQRQFLSGQLDHDAAAKQPVKRAVCRAVPGLSVRGHTSMHAHIRACIQAPHPVTFREWINFPRWVRWLSARVDGPKATRTRRPSRQAGTQGTGRPLATGAASSVPGRDAMATEPSFPPVPEPDPPTEEDIEAMRAHRQEEHGEDFDLRRDVSYAGNASETAPMTFVAATPAAGPKYRCKGCEGRVFMLPDPYVGTPERRDHLRSFDPQVRTLLAGVDPQDEDALIDRIERRRLGLFAPAPAEPPTRRRETTARRIEDCYEFLYQRRLAGRTVNEAISDLTDLHETNPALYREIVGTTRLYEAETFRDYYKELPEDKKKAAKETSRRLRASGEAKPKYDTKFTG
jgi:hypothetical protein